VPQLVLSLAWGFAVLISWSAVTGTLERETWLLWGATVLWTLGFDTVYAMADREDDLRVGVNSSAIFFGRYAAQAVGVFFIATAVLLGKLGSLMELGWVYWISLLGAIALWGWQYLRLSRTRTAAPNAALFGQIFRQNVWVGFVLLAGMGFGFL
ncbi:MAG: UbiA family prenyltransferase, partial [Cyanobacteriota bacterium]